MNDIVHTTPGHILQDALTIEDGTQIHTKAHQRAYARSHNTPPIPTAALNERAAIDKQNSLPLVIASVPAAGQCTQPQLGAHVAAESARRPERQGRSADGGNDIDDDGGGAGVYGCGIACAS